MITTLEQYKKIFEKKNDFTDLIICDVQESFKKYFNNTYLLELKDFAEDFTRVYQIYDTIDGDLDYYFPNQIEAYEKQYGGELTIDDIDYYFVDENTKELLYNKFKENNFSAQDKFETKTGDYWIFIDGQHEWFYCEKDLVLLFKKMSEQKRKICLVGGAEGECIYDIYETLRSFNVDVEYDMKYIYSFHGTSINEEDSDIVLDKFLNEIEDEDIDESKKEINKECETNTDINKIEVYEDIPEDMYIDKIIDVFDNVDDLKESYGNQIDTTNMINRQVGRNDILWITCLLKPRNKSVAYPMGEMGVVKVKVLETFYGLNKLKQLKATDYII